MFDALHNKDVVVTGATGFFGKHVCKALRDAGAFVTGLRSADWDMTDARVPTPVMRALRNTHYVVHLAGYNGGIQFNLDNPADIFSRNTLMGLNLLNACKDAQISHKVLLVVASCAWPALQWTLTPNTHGTPFEMRINAERETCPESEFLEGPPHPSVACHGYAKRNLQLGAEFFNRQYGLPAVTACVTTLYGPGDSFDLKRTKVVGSLIRRFVVAKLKELPEVVCWGTGSARRELIYVEDAARDLVLALMHYDDSTMPLNCGIGTEISIRELAERVASTVGYKGKICWDTTKPDGQLRKKLDTKRFEELFRRVRPELGRPEYSSLDWGLRQTVDWYMAQL